MLELETNLRFVPPCILNFHPADIKVNVSTDGGYSPQFFVHNLLLQNLGDTVINKFLQLENTEGSLIGLWTP